MREFEASTATVEAAAAAVGVEPARIAKSLSFKIEERTILIIAAGDVKVDNSKYKATFGGKAKMLTAEEAVELMLSIAAETGYLVKGNVEADANTVKISVSGDTGYAKKLAGDIESKVSSTLKALDIEGKVEKIDALSLEALRALASSTSLYTEEEIEAMDEKELYNVIAIGRI